jgi:LmbE family N-acetylglucosaminyl deacetylase
VKNILFVGAHHDDCELAMGGSAKRWTEEGQKVCSAILTTSEWKTPEGAIRTTFAQTEKYCRKSAALLGYKPYNLQVSGDFDLRYDDSIVVSLLKIIRDENIDTLITIWPRDAHPIHRIASDIALNATRKVPNVLTAKISWNSSGHAFRPTFFVDITRYIELKIQALQCYEDEFERTGRYWERFIRSSCGMYGLEANCEYAEAFEVIKYRY